MDNKSHITDHLALCAHFSSAAFFILFIYGKRKELFVFFLRTHFPCVVLHVLPCSSEDNACCFGSLFLAFHQGGHLAHCFRMGGNTKAVFSSPWPWGLIFKGASCTVSPTWQWEHSECLRTTRSSIPWSENLWKVVAWSYRDTLFMMIIIDWIGFNPILNLVSRVHGEDGEGTCDLGHSCLFSYHLSLKCKWWEVCSNSFIDTEVDCNFSWWFNFLKVIILGINPL